MTTPLKTTGYDRVFALDTQMVFEARPLEQLEDRTVGVAQVEVRVTARNMRGSVSATMVAPVEVSGTVLG